MSNFNPEYQYINPEYIDLYNRIQSFSFDEIGASFSFTQKLAREQGWSLDYTNRAIEEYKKFVFLAIVADHGVCPSEQVDQVWHLHLTYTKSYWEEFCPNVLQRPLHHEPTKGGYSQRLKHLYNYNKTLESYKHFFRQFPPVDIWSEPELRFGRDICFVRVNPQSNWILPKPNVKFLPAFKLNQLALFLALFALSFVMVSCQSIAGINLMSFAGWGLLIFHTVTIIIGLTLAFKLQYLLRFPEGKTETLSEPENLHPYEVAFLVNGEKQMIFTAITSLVQQKYFDVGIDVEEKKRLMPKKSVDDSLHFLEKELSQNIELSQGNMDRLLLFRSLKSAEKIHNKLKAIGLLLSSDQVYKALYYPSFVGLSSFLLILIQLFSGKIFDFLSISFCIFLLLFILLNFKLKDPYRSHYGDSVVESLATRFHGLRRLTNDDSQIPLAVALFGEGVLETNSAYADLCELFNSIDDGGCGCC
ncbi:TIGR04222 domain-containing membrane protein [Planktothrix sp. FACHB-1365]|uniref:TIGR04222 domain-containing membrane protein n=1 Tax=Planktothrix sp. FACHB-1365 TaxID=2692855 RepID=UPI0016851D84|nr:TIGR04222 domain-containing membrane protein [Planktothrix sp. FACHB-1365]MBD2485637.1 TIGR04222 domain-containing membrane protein [Planktothrix sp. FACHB-1365]